jgi:hypothetical protein
MSDSGLAKKRPRSGGIDSDYAWLKSHLDFAGSIETRRELAQKIKKSLAQHIESGRLPYTLGVFGGWGSGKTTLMAMLAEELENTNNCKVVYFNSWKYAGFMEIVPALIYKILQYGVVGTTVRAEEAARRVLLALGKKYSDQIGEWAEKKMGVNPVELFKDIYDVASTIKGSTAPVMPEVIRAYYTQVDEAQDELRRALGMVTPGQAPAHAVVVLIDELDRCDPDEAFTVIKQMRVLFGMRDLPVAFVVCANPEPIGLAIKHRYGLESEAGDYEARRILEKFVDSYQDLSATEPLGELVQTMWKRQSLPWIVKIDEANARPGFEEDTLLNATAFDAFTTAVPLFANIRVLQKSFEYVRETVVVNRHFLWTHWFPEIANQIDPHFRRDLHTLSKSIPSIISAAYDSLHGVVPRVKQAGRTASVVYETDKGGTLFSIFRSFFWEHAREELKILQTSKDPQDVGRSRALATLLSEPLRVDFVVLLSLFPFDALSPKSGVKTPILCLQRFEFPGSGEDSMDSLLNERRILQAENGTVLWSCDLTGKQEEIETELLQSERLPVGLQAGSLESRNEVVSQANDFQVEGIRGKGTGGDFRQGEVLAQFPDAPFHGGAAIIEMPDAGGSQWQIGYPGTVDITTESEKVRLRFGLRAKPSCDHETTGSAPAMRAMLELRYFPVTVHRLIAQSRQQGSEGPTQAGYHGILSRSGFQGVEHRVKGEARIGTSTNLPDVGRNVREGSIE